MDGYEGRKRENTEDKRVGLVFRGQGLLGMDFTMYKRRLAFNLTEKAAVKMVV